MKRFLRRWLELEKPRAPPAPPSDPPELKATRVSRLEERVDFLEGALNRLRGQVTGGLAHKPKSEEEPQSPQDPSGSTLEPEEPLDRWQQLSRAKGRKRGLLQG